MQRVEKLLSQSGQFSRKEITGYLKAGRVKTDTGLACTVGGKYSEETIFLLDGVALSTEKDVYLMLHKPAGVISSTDDPREKTVLDILPEQYRKQGLFPVGRLDKDTEGLLLLTNDGALAHRLLSPKKHVKKVYHAQLEQPITEADVLAFAEGILLKDGTVCQSAKLQVLGEATMVSVSICEGKYHQVKRMFAARGNFVQYLKRIAMGNLHLDENLPKGGYRLLSENEKKALLLTDLPRETFGDFNK